MSEAEKNFFLVGQQYSVESCLKDRVKYFCDLRYYINGLYRILTLKTNLSTSTKDRDIALKKLKQSFQSINYLFLEPLTAAQRSECIPLQQAADSLTQIQGWLAQNPHDDSKLSHFLTNDFLPFTENLRLNKIDEPTKSAASTRISSAVSCDENLQKMYAFCSECKIEKLLLQLIFHSSICATIQDTDNVNQSLTKTANYSFQLEARNIKYMPESALGSQLQTLSPVSLTNLFTPDLNHCSLVWKNDWILVHHKSDIKAIMFLCDLAKADYVKRNPSQAPEVVYEKRLPPLSRSRSANRLHPIDINISPKGISACIFEEHGLAPILCHWPLDEQHEPPTEWSRLHITPQLSYTSPAISRWQSVYCSQDGHQLFLARGENKQKGDPMELYCAQFDPQKKKLTLTASQACTLNFGLYNQHFWNERKGRIFSFLVRLSPRNRPVCVEQIIVFSSLHEVIQQEHTHMRTIIPAYNKRTGTVAFREPVPVLDASPLSLHPLAWTAKLGELESLSVAEKNFLLVGQLYAAEACLRDPVKYFFDFRYHVNGLHRTISGNPNLPKEKRRILSQRFQKSFESVDYLFLQPLIGTQHREKRPILQAFEVVQNVKRWIETRPDEESSIEQFLAKDLQDFTERVWLNKDDQYTKSVAQARLASAVGCDEVIQKLYGHFVESKVEKLLLQLVSWSSLCGVIQDTHNVNQSLIKTAKFSFQLQDRTIKYKPESSAVNFLETLTPINLTSDLAPDLNHRALVWKEDKILIHHTYDITSQMFVCDLEVAYSLNHHAEEASEFRYEIPIPAMTQLQSALRKMDYDINISPKGITTCIFEENSLGSTLCHLCLNNPSERLTWAKLLLTSDLDSTALKLSRWQSVYSSQEGNLVFMARGENRQKGDPLELFCAQFDPNHKKLTLHASQTCVLNFGLYNTHFWTERKGRIFSFLVHKSAQYNCK